MSMKTIIHNEIFNDYDTWEEYVDALCLFNNILFYFTKNISIEYIESGLSVYDVKKCRFFSVKDGDNNKITFYQLFKDGSKMPIISSENTLFPPKL